MLPEIRSAAVVPSNQVTV